MIHRAAILPPRATMDDLAAGTPVPALATPLLDAACLSDADELHRVAPVDERSRYAAMKERAEKAEATWHAGQVDLDDVAGQLVDMSDRRDAALQLLAEVWASRPLSSMPWLRERVEAVLAAGGARDTAPTAADFAAMAGLPDDRCPHCGLGADLCPHGARDDCAIVNSLPTHGEVMALPGHDAAERREHPSETPAVPTTNGVVDVQVGGIWYPAATAERLLRAMGDESPEQRRAATTYDAEREPSR